MRLITGNRKDNDIMDNWRLVFPEVTDADVAFGGYPRDWFSKTLAMYESPADDKWGDLASRLFFSGGTIPTNKELPQEYLVRGKRLLKAVLGSWESKHEDKEAVCGLILKSICEK